MKAPNDLPKIQHYVPRFLLKNFTKGDRRQIWVYDKQSSKSYRTNVKNIAAEDGFYDFEHQTVVVSVEPRLELLESKSSKLIKRIEREESIGWLSLEDRMTLSMFVLVQKMRTLYPRNSALHLDRLLQDKIRDMGGDPAEIKNYEPLDEEGARFLSIQMITFLSDLVPYIYEKDWILHRGRKGNPFYISDNPVSLQNMTNHGPRGSLGLGVKGIQINLPLSSTFTLGIYCTSVTNQLRKYQHLLESMPPVFKELFKDDTSKQIIAGLEDGVAVQCSDDNILKLNHLQVRWAERQVYCEDNSFWLVEDMLRKSELYRTGPRMTS